MISSYKAAQLHMEKARNKAKGRPMNGAGWRLFQDGDEYAVRVYDHEVGRFLPDNTFMFTTDGEASYAVAQSLSATMNRNLPFRWARVGYKKYRVEHRENLDDGGGLNWEWMLTPTNSPIVYTGLTFDLTTGKCLNPKPDEAFKPKVNEANRKVWLAALRAWKRKLKVAARLGAFDKLIAEERASPTGWVDRPVWNDPKELDILYKAIKDCDCGTDLIRMFAASEVNIWGSASNSMDLYERIEKVVKNQSIELRKRFGAIEEK
jgi:hypothetical protein